jgi:hypothetical protein
MNSNRYYEMGWACGVHGGGERCIKHFGWGGLKGGDHYEDLGIDGRITLRWILGKLGLGMWIGFIGSGQGQVAGCCEHGDEPSDSIKCGEFLD